METKTHKIDGRAATVYFLGDVHIGAANHQKDAFARAIKRISETDCYWIGMGDYLDCINHRDPRFNPKEINPQFSISDLDNLPKLQADSFIKSVMPIKDRCLGLIAGNHEAKFKKHNTYDVMSHLCKELGVTYLSGKAFINLIINDYPVSIHVCHGVGGGGMREGYPVNKIHDIARWEIADVHVIGHIHQLACDRAVFTKFHYNVVQKIKVWYGVSGCFLSKAELNTESYYEQNPGKSSGIGMLKLDITAASLNYKKGIITEMYPVYLD